MLTTRLCYPPDNVSEDTYILALYYATRQSGPPDLLTLQHNHEVAVQLNNTNTFLLLLRVSVPFCDLTIALPAPVYTLHMFVTSTWNSLKDYELY